MCPSRLRPTYPVLALGFSELVRRRERNETGLRGHQPRDRDGRAHRVAMRLRMGRRSRHQTGHLRGASRGPGGEGMTEPLSKHIPFLHERIRELEADNQGLILIKQAAMLEKNEWKARAEKAEQRWDSCKRMLEDRNDSLNKAEARVAELKNAKCD